MTCRGNVGIGTTAPGTKLDVWGTAGANNIFNVASSTGTSVFRINNDGNVGIGTTNPNSKLEVNGAIRLDDNSLYLRGGADVSNGIVWGSEVDGPRVFGWSGIGFGTNNTGSYSEKARINSAGNIGIGTTTPTAKLTIGGTAGTDGIMFPDGTTQTTAAGGGGCGNPYGHGGSGAPGIVIVEW